MLIKTVVDIAQDWKSIETVEKSFIEIINQKDYDVSAMFFDENKPPKSPHEHYKKRSDRMETEGYYIQVRYTCLPE